MPAHTFNVVYEGTGDGWVYAHVPELPEVHTQGESLDQARGMVKDAIALVLDERRARGEAIPCDGAAARTRAGSTEPPTHKLVSPSRFRGTPSDN